MVRPGPGGIAALRVVLAGPAVPGEPGPGQLDRGQPHLTGLIQLERHERLVRQAVVTAKAVRNERPGGRREGYQLPVSEKLDMLHWHFHFHPHPAKQVEAELVKQAPWTYASEQAQCLGNATIYGV